MEKEGPILIRKDSNRGNICSSCKASVVPVVKELIKEANSIQSFMVLSVMEKIKFSAMP